MTKIQIRRPEFPASLGEGHGPFTILEEVHDLEDAYVLTKLRCVHCGFGFWNIHIGKYGDPNKQAYTIEEVTIK